MTEDGIFFDIAPDGDGRNRIYVNFYDAGTFSIEVSRGELVRLHNQLGSFLNPSPAPSRCACGGDCTGHREIGTCVYGKPKGKDIICLIVPKSCEYQTWKESVDVTLCGRESAALKMAERERNKIRYLQFTDSMFKPPEEPAELQPAIPENLRERLTRSIDKEHPSEWEKGYLAFIERIFKDENCDKAKSK